MECEQRHLTWWALNIKWSRLNSWSKIQLELEKYKTIYWFKACVIQTITSIITLKFRSLSYFRVIKNLALITIKASLVEWSDVDVDVDMKSWVRFPRLAIKKKLIFFRLLIKPRRLVSDVLAHRIHGGSWYFRLIVGYTSSFFYTKKGQTSK